jgi:hypothetical protein
MAAPFDFSGTWRSSYFLTRIVAKVSQSGNRVWGVVEVTGPLGGTDLYHVNGRVKGMQVVAWHYNGRQFRGRATGEEKAEGVLTTKAGDRLNLKAVRVEHSQAGGERPA